MKNIQSISDSYLCSNCGACSAFCAKDAIEFKWSPIGRLYASVNDNCVDCGLCQKVCPSIDVHNLHETLEDRFVGNIERVYVGRSTNEQYFRNAQSGGVATGILAYLFDTKKIDAAVACRMEYGITPQVIPFIARSKEDLVSTQKSCYTPVALLTVLQETPQFKSVAIVGLPCHIQGVKELQKTSKKYSNIKYCIGLVCDRTECAGIQDVIKNYIKFDEFKIHWRQKYNDQSGKFDYKSAPIVGNSKEGESISLPRHYRIALKDMFTPPRCRVCWDKLNVFADITLGDPWRLKDIDAVQGESLVIVRSSVGASLLAEMINEGAVVLRVYDKEAPLRSQFIADRRKQVEMYSCALNKISNNVDCYLLRQGQDISTVDTSSSEKALEEFFKLETLSKSDILHKAEDAVKRHEQCKNKKKCFISRLISKLRKLVKPK